MTNTEAFAHLAGIVSDPSLSMPRDQRYQRLLDAFATSFPCDAVALLEYEGEYLVPRATRGLSADTAGRRFLIRRQPRLAQILNGRGPVRFPADSPLPDPYDGLLEQEQADPYIHDCMGGALYVDARPWGVITLDALAPGTFDNIDFDVLSIFVDVTSATVRAADWIRRLEQQIARHHHIERAHGSGGMPEELIGRSEVMAQLRREAETVAASDLTVLVFGETGVGKELMVRLLHRLSSRANEPMVHVNCAAVPEALAESELFGHVRGAFSGAIDHRIGKFELAHEGTLFLDEVGELPLAIQAKLLRALQNGEVLRIGSDAPMQVDVRVIAATNRDLKAEVAAGRFRADLYHRLSVYPLCVPPLRERIEDILPLAGYFLECDQRRHGLRGVRLGPEARRWLAGFAWSGNVRELEHSLSRGIIRALSSGARRDRLIELDLFHLGIESSADPVGVAPDEASASLPASIPLHEAVDSFKRRLIEQRLREHQDNHAAAAASLGVDRGNFSRMLKRLQLR